MHTCRCDDLIKSYCSDCRGVDATWLDMGPDDHNFEFVQHEPNVALSRENRTKIRRHAMKAVGAARLRSSGSTSLSYYGASSDRRLQYPIPLSGFELLIRDYGLDPMDFSALIAVHIGPM